MALKTFDFKDAATSAALNALVGTLPKTFLYALQRPNSAVASSATGGGWLEKVRIDVSPIMGDYLFSQFEIKSSSGAYTVQMRIKLDDGVNSDVIFTASTSSTSYVRNSSVDLLTSLPNIGDAVGKTLDIVVEVNIPTGATLTRQNIKLQSGMKATVADYFA